MVEGSKIILGLHLYQPHRRVSHQNLRHIKTDPLGADWTQIINQECYRPLAQSGVFEKASFTFYGSLRDQLEELDKATLKEVLKHFDKNGVGGSYLHPLLPDLDDLDKEILVGAGFRNQNFFWSPEGALDNSTLKILSEYGYQAVILAPSQIDYKFKKDLGKPVFVPEFKIHLVPFNKRLSDALAFEDKTNADLFFKRFIQPNFKKDKVLIGWTDGETFGHHQKDGDKFLDYLIKNTLPQNNVEVVSINDLDLSDSADGKLVERTAWSCPHGNLIRWQGECPCSSGDLRWKNPFYLAHKHLNDLITREPNFDVDLKRSLIKNFRVYLKEDDKKFSFPALCLLRSKASALGSRISCGTFFDDPHTSGYINLLFGYQAIEYLKDSGLTKKASELECSYKKDLSKIPDPKNPGKTGLDMLENLLNQDNI